MKLTVLNVAYPMAAVGPDAVGGAEHIPTMLDEALARAGHRSVVVACEGSRVHGELVPASACSSTYSGAAIEEARRGHLAAILSALQRWPVDVIHMHGLDFYEYLPPAGVPLLVTLHLPPAWYPAKVFRLSRPDTFVHCVSFAQEKNCPSNARLLPVIENGIDPERLSFRPGKRNFALALGRICPEKGFHLAIAAAERARVPLLLAGRVFPFESHFRYFNEQLVPRFGNSVRFIGPLGSARKKRFLANARCLLIPSLAPETSSLVAMEALASGTPVIAFRAGALADIVEHGQTGYLVNDEREMAEAIHKVDRIDPVVCRQAALRRFSAARMTERYLDVYHELALASRLPRRAIDGEPQPLAALRCSV